MLRNTFLALTLAATSALAQKADPFAEGVRTTEPLAPAEQRTKFKLPPGFEIQLVAAEPDLRKPMNMAFDATGRLWVSESREYPFPAKEGAELRDSIRIFSDFGPDGKARKMEIFADKLNIPIGLYPFRTADGHWKCVAWSIPNIWLFEDTDGDGKADKREVLFGPLGWERDTHGNQASFRRGDDGWLYATHGFNNNSIIKAKDGSTITLNSGNVYRFKIDGSRVEQYTWGQVNPFGLCWDDRGNLFSADCHSSPIYQLLKGGYYPSFGKPHDGLGFAPQTIQHSHGSTAICGPMMIRDTSWPADLQGHLLVGNVMTSRLNHDLIEWHGASSKGKELPDFLTSEDPWFRPVDLQWGPDGALYIADFYNRIIGHYEVPLQHPGRDRERGRIWRVVYKGDAQKKTADAQMLPADLPLAVFPPADSNAPLGTSVCEVSEESTAKNPASKAEAIAVAPDEKLPKAEQIAALIKELGSPNPTRRSLALNELCDRFEIEPSATLDDAVSEMKEPFQKMALSWLHSRADRNSNIAIYGMKSPNPFVRTHALRVISEMLAGTRRNEGEFFRARSNGASDYPPGLERAVKQASEVVPNVRTALADKDPVVRRVAAEALAAYPQAASVAALLTLLRTTDKADDHLIYSTRVALREHLRDEEVVKALKLDAFSREDLAAILDIMPAVPGEHAALLRLDLFTKLDVSAGELAKQLPSIIKNAPADRLGEVALLARKKMPGDATTLASILAAHDARGVAPGAVLAEWASAIVPAQLAQKATAWEDRPYMPHTPNRAYGNPFALQDRKSSDDQTTALMSSFPRGETLTGVLRSAPFAAPEKLRFYLCGHDGPPPGAPGKKNFVRLVDAGGKTLRETAPPRNDVAQRIEWDLADLRGAQVRFEATDGDSGTAYAWLAFGRFKPELPELAFGSGSNRAVAAELAGRFKLAGTSAALATLFADRAADVESRAAAGRALLAVAQPVPAVGPVGVSPAVAGRTPAIPTGGTPVLLSAALASADEPDALREKIAVALAAHASQSVADAMPSASTRLQQSFATALSANPEGTRALIAAIEAGKASPLVLRDKATADRLRVNAKDDELKRLEVLLAKLPPANVEADKLIADRRAGFTKGDAAKGSTVFQTNCAVCHQIGQKGALVGPQLDGIGGRGLDRILEDILDPNRNVDRAFRLSIVTLKDGGVASGLLRREEGGQMVLADITGKESSIPQSNVAKREESETSLMPPAFGQTIAPGDFNDLLAYLLSQRPTK